MSTTPTLTTADESFMMLDDGFRYELVRGEARRTPPAGSEHGATRTVAIYTSHTDVMRLTESDTLDGGEILLGFTCRVAELFL